MSLNPFPNRFELDNFIDLFDSDLFLDSVDEFGGYLGCNDSSGDIFRMYGCLCVQQISLSRSSTWAYGFSCYPDVPRDDDDDSLVSSPRMAVFVGCVLGINFGLQYNVYSILCVDAKGYFDTIPTEIEESAVMDGASQFTIFWRIIMPLSRPAIAVTALFSFMTAWNEFILAATFLRAMRQAIHLPVRLQQYVTKYNTDWGTFCRRCSGG